MGYDIVNKGDVMPASDAMKRANRKYREKTYEQVNFHVHIGQRDAIKEYAEKRGESLAGFINRAIEETMKRDGEVFSE